MKQFMGLFRLGALALVFLFSAAVSEGGSLETYGAVEAADVLQRDGKLEPSVWYHGFDVVKKYAEDNGIPLFTIWVNKGCSVCNLVTKRLLSPEFKAWQQTDEGKVLYCVLAGGDPRFPEDRQKGPHYMWLKNGTMTKFPFVVLYWSVDGQVKTKLHTQGLDITHVKGNSKSAVENIIQNQKNAFAGWKYNPQFPDQDEWDPVDNVLSYATPIQVSAQTLESGIHYLTETDTNDWYKVILFPQITETNTIWFSDVNLDTKKETFESLNLRASFFREEVKVVSNEETQVAGILTSEAEDSESDQTKTAVFQTNLVTVAELKFAKDGSLSLVGDPVLADPSQKFSLDPYGKIQISGMTNLYLQVSRDPGNLEDPTRMKYTLNARKYLNQNIGFKTNSVSCSEKTSSLKLTVVSKGEFTENLTGKLVFIDGTAKLEKNYKLPAATDKLAKDGFSWKSNGENSFSVTIIDDRNWNPSQKFQIKIVPDDPSVNLLNQGVVTVSIDEITPPENGIIALDSYKEPTSGRNKRIGRSTKITVKEGDVLPELIAVRSKGHDEAVTAKLVWEDGSSISTFNWNAKTEGDQKSTIQIPSVPGYQEPKEFTATLKAEPDTIDISSSKSTLHFLVYDSEYGMSLSDYDRAADPDVSMKTKDDGWFVAKDRAYTSYQGGKMTTSLRGPGVFSFKAVGDLKGLSAEILRFDDKPIALSAIKNDHVSLIIPSGSKTVEFEYKNAKPDGETYVKLSDFNFIPLSKAAEPVAPLSRESVVVGETQFSWNTDSISIPGVQVNTLVHRSDLEKKDKTGIDCGGASSTNLVLTETGSLSWWTEVVVNDDFEHQVQIKSKKQSIKVLEKGVADFDKSEQAPMGPEGEWQENGSGVVFDGLYAGVQVKLGPVALAEGSDGMKKASGSLPSGLKIVTSDEGETFIEGIPARAVTNTCLFQALAGRKAGATLPVTFKIAALPSNAVGTFIGLGCLSDPLSDDLLATSNGVMNVTVSSAGRITGSISLGGKKFSMKANGFDSFSPTNAVGENQRCFFITNTNTFLAYGSGKKRIEIPIQLYVFPDSGTGCFEVEFSSSDQKFDAHGERNFWRDRQKPAVTEKFNELVGYYTAQVACSNVASGYLTATVSKGGRVKLSGKLPDGKSVSASSTLVADVDLNPIAYYGTTRGNEFAGEIQWDLETKNIFGGSFWMSHDQKNLFAYSMEIEGGIYSKERSLYDVFGVKKHELMPNFCISFKGLEQTTAVISKDGRSIKLNDCGTNQISSYRLALKITPSTGLYSGSIYLGKTRNTIAGVLVPALSEPIVQEGDEGGLMGVGFCVDPKTGVSQDFSLIHGCPGCGE